MIIHCCTLGHMHAYLVVGQDNEQKISELISLKSAHPIDFDIKSIEDTRELGRISRYSAKETRAFVIRTLSESSIEAQNAFLKTLEEPSENTIFILSAESIDTILDTIVSRCEMVTTQAAISEKDKELFKTFIGMATAERLDFVSGLGGRDEAKLFLKSLMAGAHGNIADQNVATLLDASDLALTRIYANANPALQLTNMVISLEKK